MNVKIWGVPEGVEVIATWKVYSEIISENFPIYGKTGISKIERPKGLHIDVTRKD